MVLNRPWNESQVHTDPTTGRCIRRLTCRGRINQTPTYHTNSGFSADSRWLVFVTVRDGATWVVRADVGTGELTAVWRAPGIGDRSYIHRDMEFSGPDIDGRGICGNRLTIAPRTRQAVFTCERQIHRVDLATLEHRVLAEAGPEWIFGAPCVSPNERWVAITLSSAHPELLAGKAKTRRYVDFPDHRLRVVRVPTAGGDLETLYEAAPAQSAHSAFCPGDGNLLYFDLDLPPHYWGGGDGRTPRIWLLDIARRSARPLKRHYPAHFQVHQAWLWDGSGMCYHGSLPNEGGQYFGIARVDGRNVWEQVFPQAKFYGHNTPDPVRPALILDGGFSRHLLQWLYYDRPGSIPNLEPICAHNTEWGSLPGQYSHPHPLADPAGKYVSFTAARDGRSDVFVVEV